MDEYERDMCVYIECSDFRWALKDMKKEYKHQNENVKEFLFADEFGIIEVQKVQKE